MKFGFHFHANNGTFSTVPFKAPLRLWDCVPCQWNALQPTNTTSNVTPVLQAVQKYGDVMYTLGPTPTWATSSTNVGKYWTGSNSNPDKTDITALVTAIVNTGITAIEPINEVLTICNGTATGWTPALIVAHCQKVFQVAKLANPNIIVLAPSLQYLSIADAQQCIALGLDAWVDKWSFHSYYSSHMGWFEYTEEALMNYKWLIQSNKPIWITEAGCNETISMSYDWWRQIMRRWSLLDSPQYSVERIYLYSLDDGTYGFNTPQALAALSRANN